MRRRYPFDQSSEYYHPNNGSTHPLDAYYANLYQQYNRKRQRRQAAAIVVESLWNNNNSDDTSSGNQLNNTTATRKSTAQPRPVLTVPPKGIGPIADPNVNDVLCGRGGRINSHAGNVQFRDIIVSKKKDYLAPTTKKLEKAHIAAGIVNDIRTMNPPGRFLKEEKGDGMWYDIGDAKAIKKTGQALREDAPEIRPAIDTDGGSSGDEKKPGTSMSAEKTGMIKTAGKSKGRSPNASPRGNRQGNIIMDEQHQQQNLVPILPQQQQQQQQIYSNNNMQRQGSAPDYHGQMSMPPPFMSEGNNNNTYSSQQASQQQQFMQQHQSLQDQQGFETRNIPIQVPLQQGNQSSFPSHTSQLYHGVQSATNKFGSASRTAMEALSQAGPNMMQQQQQHYAPYGQSGRHPEDFAFGMGFHGDDNTISTISGLSEPVSSIRSGTGRGMSDLMNMSLKSNISLTDSLRLKSSLLGGTSSQNRTYDQLMQGGSTRSGSLKGYDTMMLAGLNGSIKSGFGGSLARSNSFPDNMNGSADNVLFEGDNEDENYSDRSMNRRRGSSAMSIGSIMDVQSDASSMQWLQASVGNLPLPDDRSYMSSAMMSADLDALDLASTF